MANTKVPVELFDAGAGFTIGSGAAEDTKIVFDGNAQDYYVGLDDSADKLIIGVGSAVGTTAALSVDSSQNLEIEGTLNTLGFKGPRGNFTNSMLISDDATTGTLSSASNNTGFGRLVFNALTSGTGNTAVGADCLSVNTTGINNIAIGLDALKANTIGFQNTVAGVFAMDGSVAASRNTAIGYAALSGITAATATDTHNTGVGAGALQVLTSGTKNTAIGRDAGISASTGDDCTFVGFNAGGSNTTGSNNIFIGVDAGDGAGEVNDTENNSIYIGNNTGGNNGTNNEYVLGHNCRGIGGVAFTFGSDASNNRVYNFYATNASWTRVSDERYKEEITNNTDCGLDFINDLRPVTFKWKPKANIDKTLSGYDASKTTREYDEKMYGLIAQEVKDALDKHNITDFGGWHEESSGIQGISQEMFVHPLIKAVQELSEKCDSLQKEINDLKGN